MKEAVKNISGVQFKGVLVDNAMEIRDLKKKGYVDGGNGFWYLTTEQQRDMAKAASAPAPTPEPAPAEPEPAPAEEEKAEEPAAEEPAEEPQEEAKEE